MPLARPRGGIAATAAEGQPLRVFVCEFVTGGGMRGEAPSPSLAREGTMMRDALIRDLSDLGCAVITSHDDRLRPAPRAQSTPVANGEDAWRLWREIAEDCDAAWLVAPETGGALARLTALARDACGEVVGPDEDAIRIASSKKLTAERLLSRGVTTPPVWRPGETPAGAAGPFVSKPDDGAGCEATRLWRRRPAEIELPDDHVVQSFVDGEHASLTVLTVDGVTRLLAVNRQHLTVEDGAFAVRGLSIAAVDDRGRAAGGARGRSRSRPARPFRHLWRSTSSFGSAGPVVIEVNPRLTTAYVGLREALGVNPGGAGSAVCRT